MNHNLNTTMCATVLEVQQDSLLVCDCCTRQQVQVNTDQACCFSVSTTTGP